MQKSLNISNFSHDINDLCSSRIYFWALYHLKFLSWLQWNRFDSHFTIVWKNSKEKWKKVLILTNIWVCFHPIKIASVCVNSQHNVVTWKPYENKRDLVSLLPPPPPQHTVVRALKGLQKQTEQTHSHSASYTTIKTILHLHRIILLAARQKWH